VSRPIAEEAEEEKEEIEQQEEEDTFEKDEAETSKLKNEIEESNKFEGSIAKIENAADRFNQAIKIGDKSIQEDNWDDMEELKEGGEDEHVWFDFKRFMEEVTVAWNELAADLDANDAEQNVHRVFDKIKRWKVVTKKSLLVTFQRYCQRGKLITTEALGRFLAEVWDTVLQADDKKRYVDSIMLAYEAEANKMDYTVFSNQFFIYANRSMLANSTTLSNEERD
jgi:hypothetical protein